MTTLSELQTQDAELLPAVRSEQPMSLFGTSEPVEVLKRAGNVAAALKDVVKRQGLISNIQGKEYPRCEAWTLLGTMIGVFPVLSWTRPIENGWEARVEAKTKDGVIVGAAEAECLRSEKNWSNREDFALRSMAQTRATAKALRMPLGFVMTLAGYEPTPAEEMGFESAKLTQKAKPNVAAFTPAAEATKDQKARFIKCLEPVREAGVKYAIDKGWILPVETLLDIPLSKVPKTQKEFQAIMDDIKTLMDGDQIPGAEAKGSDVAPEAPDPIQQTEGVIGNVSVTNGKKKNGQPWTRYGILMNGEWYGSFSTDLGQQAEQLKGRNVRLLFERGDKGNNAVELQEL